MGGTTTAKSKPTKNVIAKEKEEKEPSSLFSTILKTLMYISFFVIFIMYGIFVFRPEVFQSATEKFPQIQKLEQFFQMVEKYSPFHEFLDDDLKTKEDFANRVQATNEQQQQKPIIFTKALLKEYDGSVEGKGPYLALLGQVFDVSKGKDHYGPGGGYGFFSGIDGSRAFVTGEFNEAGLIDDVTGLSPGDYLGLKEWVEFYNKDYKYIGKVIGKFYDSSGAETPYWKEVQKWIDEAQQDKDAKSAEQKMFPSCNTEWSQDKGHRVWCTKKSGGIMRDWVGRPRRLFYPGRSERCACVKDFGPPSTDPGSKANSGDLENAHLKEYDGCDSKASSCKVLPVVVEKKDEL